MIFAFWQGRLGGSRLGGPLAIRQQIDVNGPFLPVRGQVGPRSFSPKRTLAFPAVLNAKVAAAPGGHLAPKPIASINPLLICAPRQGGTLFGPRDLFGSASMSRVRKELLELLGSSCPKGFSRWQGQVDLAAMHEDDL
jgi:hypothetical protein